MLYQNQHTANESLYLIGMINAKGVTSIVWVLTKNVTSAATLDGKVVPLHCRGAEVIFIRCASHNTLQRRWWMLNVNRRRTTTCSFPAASAAFSGFRGARDMDLENGIL